MKTTTLRICQMCRFKIHLFNTLTWGDNGPGSIPGIGEIFVFNTVGLWDRPNSLLHNLQGSENFIGRESVTSVRYATTFTLNSQLWENPRATNNDNLATAHSPLAAPAGAPPPACMLLLLHLLLLLPLILSSLLFYLVLLLLLFLHVFTPLLFLLLSLKLQLPLPFSCRCCCSYY